jgi:hypothetical protein
LNSHTPATYTELGKSDYNTYYKTINKDVIKTQRNTKLSSQLLQGKSKIID